MPSSSEWVYHLFIIWKKNSLTVSVQKLFMPIKIHTQVIVLKFWWFFLLYKNIFGINGADQLESYPLNDTLGSLGDNLIIVPLSKNYLKYALVHSKMHCNSITQTKVFRLMLNNNCYFVKRIYIKSTRKEGPKGSLPPWDLYK